MSKDKQKNKMDGDLNQDEIDALLLGATEYYNPIAEIKMPPPEILSKDEIDALLEAISSDTTPFGMKKPKEKKYTKELLKNELKESLIEIIIKQQNNIVDDYNEYQRRYASLNREFESINKDRFEKIEDLKFIKEFINRTIK